MVNRRSDPEKKKAPGGAGSLREGTVFPRRLDRLGVRHLPAPVFGAVMVIAAPGLDSV